MEAVIRVYPTPEKLVQETAQYWAVSASDAIRTQGSFHVALSGGSTPKRLFQYLAEHGTELGIDWSRHHIYFGDERCVPPENEDSNYRMARETFLSVLENTGIHIHRVEGELEPSQAASRYEAIVQENLGVNTPDQIPQFDLILLGIGPDGHTASLFPHTTAVDRSDRLVIENYVPKLQSWRITLTFPIINAAKRVVLLSEGSGKQAIFESILQKDADPNEYPILRVNPRIEYRWHLDKAAAENVHVGQ